MTTCISLQIDESAHAVKPMNCPGGLLVYRNEPHSYRELPIKNFEFGLVHRHEKAGVLHGLFRVEQFTQDDAHIFCTEEQIEQQILKSSILFSTPIKLWAFLSFSLNFQLAQMNSLVPKKFGIRLEAH